MSEEKIELKTPKYTWYQTDKNVVINVLLKNVNKNDLLIDCKSDQIDITVKNLNDEPPYKLHFNFLYLIDAEKFSYKIMPSKIEVILFKSCGSYWNSLEKEMTERLPSVYMKDWNAITKEVSKEVAQEEEQVANNSVDRLFQKIYAEGTEDMKKAMNKSFYESGGTVLSTNWTEVKDKEVTVRAPDGMEFKTWSS